LPSPVTIAIKTDLLEFDYSWSAEAAAVPQLDRRFRADAARQQLSALRTAREDRRLGSTRQLAHAAAALGSGSSS
jgi:hypothetical protein